MITQVQLFSHFTKIGGTEKITNLSKITQLGSGRARIKLKQSETRAVLAAVLYCLSPVIWLIFSLCFVCFY